MTNARSTTASRNGTSAERDQQRPTLKRRQPGQPESTDPNATPAPGSTETDPKSSGDRPTLKRRGETKPPDNN